MVQEDANKDMEGGNSNPSMSPGQGASAGAHGAKDDHEEEVFGTCQLVQILEGDLVRGDSQIFNSQESMGSSPSEWT